MQALLQVRRGWRPAAAKVEAMLAAVILAAIAVPLLIAVLAVGLRLARVAGLRIDGACEPTAAAPPAGVDMLPGPLQLVDDADPSTKLCPGCTEILLSAAPACRRCHHRFEPRERVSGRARREISA